MNHFPDIRQKVGARIEKHEKHVHGRITLGEARLLALEIMRKADERRLRFAEQEAQQDLV